MFSVELGNITFPLGIIQEFPSDFRQNSWDIIVLAT